MSQSINFSRIFKCHSSFHFPTVSNVTAIPFPRSFECNVTAIPFPRSFECNVTAIPFPRSFECNVTAHSLSPQFRMQCHSPFPFPAVSNGVLHVLRVPRRLRHLLAVRRHAPHDHRGGHPGHRHRGAAGAGALRGAHEGGLLQPGS